MSEDPDTKVFQLVVVEDNPGDTFLLERSFQAAGLNYALRAFEDGASAREFLQTCSSASRPDAIVIDLNLPRVSGMELLDALGKSRTLRGVLTLVMSSSPSPRDRKDVEDLGATFITKPENLQDFMRIGLDVKAALEAAAEPG